jgi:hypothetical protein
MKSCHFATRVGKISAPYLCTYYVDVLWAARHWNDDVVLLLNGRQSVN